MNKKYFAGLASLALAAVCAAQSVVPPPPDCLAAARANQQAVSGCPPPPSPADSRRSNTGSCIGTCRIARRPYSSRSSGWGHGAFHRPMYSHSFRLSVTADIPLATQEGPDEIGN